MTQHFRSLLISCCDFLHQLYHRKCLTHDVFCTIFVRLNVATFESVNPASAEQPTASMRVTDGFEAARRTHVVKKMSYV
jgi:hypothetical protein